MSGHGPGRIDPSNKKIATLLFCLALISFLVFGVDGGDPGMCAEEKKWISDHFDGGLFFNPGFRTPPPQPPSEEPQRRTSGWIWRLIPGNDWPQWPQKTDTTAGEPPAVRVSKGSLFVTPVGLATFLIQLDGLNILSFGRAEESIMRLENPGIADELLGSLGK